MLEHDHSFWMRMAIDMAREGRSKFGAVLVDEEGNFIGGFNTTKLNGPTAHAEMNVIRRMHELDYNIARDLILYTTVEPCPMCMGAILWAGIGTVVFGASIEDAAEVGKQIMISSEDMTKASWYQVEILKGIERSECLNLFNR